MDLPIPPASLSMALLMVMISLVSQTSAYARGAPSVACETMTPQHGVPPQTTPHPYKIVLTDTHISVGTPLNITLTSASGRDEFKGFIIQVRMVNSDNSFGKPEPGFTEESKEDDKHKVARLLACDGIADNAMTHVNNDPKKSVSVKWTPKAPGKYRVHYTIAKDGGVFWVKQVHEQIIEVHGESEAHGQHSGVTGHNDGSTGKREEYDWKTLCSDMKLNDSVESPKESDNPYQIKLQQYPSNKDDTSDGHTVVQKNILLINVTSEYDTPIMKLFLEVRRSKNGSLSYGKFIGSSSPKDKHQLKPVDCFGGKANAILFENLEHHDKKTSDVSLKWEAPHDEVGDFVVIGTILSEEDVFWDRIGMESDHEARRIKVLKRHTASGAKPSGSKKESSKSSVSSIHTLSRVAKDVAGRVVASFFLSLIFATM